MKRKNLIYLVSVTLIALLLTSCAGAALAQSSTPLAEDQTVQPVNRTISVNGSGKTYLTPDIAYVNIGVQTESEDAAEAVSVNNSRSQQVSDAINNLGVDEKDIQTRNFSIYPRQEFDNEGKPTGKITYIVDNTVFVTVRDLDVIGDLLNAVVAAGANSINGIQFDVADKTAALSEARQAAVVNARAIAEELASAAGVSLGNVQTISTVSSDTPVPLNMGRGAAEVMLAADASVPVSPGQMLLTVDVFIVYEIQ